MPIDLTPYAGLDPLSVIRALSLAGLDADGRLLQLNSYENRVWQAHLEDGRVVVAKFYRPGRWTDEQILEEHAYTQSLADADLPFVPPLRLDAAPGSAGLTLLGPRHTLARFSTTEEDGSARDLRFSVALRRAGRAPELEQAETLRWLGRLLGRMHEVGRQATFAQRRDLSSATLGHGPRQRLLDLGVVRRETEGAWVAASAAALDCIDESFARIPDLQTLRLHGDCHPGNVLWREEGAEAGPNFVDLDDCTTGPAVQDLWMLLPGDRATAARALHHLLGGYESFSDFDDRELQLIEPLRTLRMIHHSAWIAERWSDPAFPVAFPWFASPAYWNQQASELQAQVDRMRGATD
jgi:Ser/Thr protein kinase RdoA (MazF antagonist)